MGYTSFDAETMFRHYRLRFIRRPDRVIVESTITGEGAGSVFVGGAEYDEGKMRTDVRDAARTFLAESLLALGRS